MPELHNIQVAGHLELRPHDGGAQLIKPVSRDAVIVQHLLESDEGDNGSDMLPTTLGFLRPFVPSFTEARFVGSVSRLSEAANATNVNEVDALKRLRDMRGQLRRGHETTHVMGEESGNGNAVRDPRRMTFAEYFGLCRRTLQAAESELGLCSSRRGSSQQPPVEPCDSSNASGNLTAPITSTHSDEGIPTQPTVRRSYSTVRKPWDLYMTNVCHGMTAPTVMDLKLGKWRSTPGAERAEEKEAKDEGTTAKIHGLRLTGVHYYAFFDAPSAEAGDTETTAARFVSVSDFLEKGWERKYLTSEARLGAAIRTFLSTCTLRRREVFDGLVSEGATAKEKRKSDPPPAEPMNASLGRAVASSVWYPLNDSASGASSGDIGPSGTDSADKNASPADLTLMPALASELHRQVALLEAAIVTHKEFVEDECAFLSTSVLLVYDAAAWRRHSLAAEGVTVGTSTMSSFDPSLHVRAVLIDFDRCSPRGEHYDEGRIGFIAAIGVLKEYLREIAAQTT